MRVRAAVPVVLFTLLCFTVAGQTTGTIAGQVSDPSGAPVPQANITAENTGTGLVRNAVSTDVGSYLVPSLPPGPYKLTVERAGFKTYVQSGVTVIVGENARVDATLQIGSVTESVEVSANALRVDTQSSIVGTTVDSRRIQDMPLNGRNLLALAQLVPGVGFADFQTVTAARVTGTSLVVSGSRANQNDYRLDGSDMIANWLNQGTNLPSPDAIQEFRILTNTYDAQYGKASGGVLLAVTKSGTNEFHGSLFEYLRNDALNARNFFAGAQKPVLRQNQFGGSLGGPLRLPGYSGRDRTFFFFAYQGIRIRQQTPTITFPPTEDEKNGIFAIPVTDPTTGTPFPGNIIPKDRFDPLARNILSGYFQNHLSNQAGGQRLDLLKVPTQANQYVLKGEHQITPGNRLKFRWFRDKGGQDLASVFPELKGSTGILVDSENLSLTTVFKPNVLNEATISMQRVNGLQKPNGGRSPKELGALYNYDGEIPVEPSFSIPGRFDFTSQAYIREPSSTVQMNDMLTWVHGRHSVKLGTQIGLLRYAAFSQNKSGGSSSFSGAFTGNPMADFLIGRPLVFSQQSYVADESRSRNYHFHAQDDFKVNSRFTLNIGLRYELNLPWWQALDHQATIQPGKQSQVYPTAPLGLLYPGDPGIPRALAPADKNNFAPRIGFAWDPIGNGRTAIRAGYGIFYDTIGAVYSSHAATNPPFAVNITINPPNSFSDPYNVAHGGTDPFPYQSRISPTNALFPSSPVNTVAIDPTLRDGYLQQFNLNIQHQFSSSMFVEAAYVGKIGKKLSAYGNMNQAVYSPGATVANIQQRRPINPDHFAGVYLQNSDRHSWYHALQMKVEKRFTHGYTFQGAYTLSKSIDDTSSLAFDSGEVQDFYNRLKGQRGLSNFDQRHILALNAIWDIPFMRKNPVLGGWEVSGIARFSSGLPFSVYSGQDIALSGTGSQRMDLVGDPSLDPGRPHGELVKQFFNTAAFALPQTGKFGNSGRNILIGPGFATTDLSLQKQFKLPRERGNIEFRADFFNLFNRVNFTTGSAFGVNNGIANTQTSPAFGQLLSARDGRIVQLALRYDF